MRITYDPTADAMYIEFRRLAPGTAEARELGPELIANYGPDGRIAGLEILDASTLADEDLTRLVLEVFRPVKEASGAVRGPRTNSKRRSRKSPVPAAAA